MSVNSVPQTEPASAGAAATLNNMVFLHSPVGISLSNEHGHFIAVNEAMCRLLGRSEDELLGHSAAEFTHSDDLALQAQIGSLLDAAVDGIVRIEKRFIRPNGEVRWGWLTLTHTSGPAGQVWTMAHIQDSTQRTLVEQALRASDINLAAIERVMERIQSGDDARDVIVAASMQMCDASFALLLEPCQDEALLRVTATTDPAILDTRLVLAATLAGHVVRTRQALFVPDVAQHAQASQVLVSATGSRSIYLLPVTARAEVIGVLVIGWRHARTRLEAPLMRAVTLLSAEAGVALRQDRLVAELNGLARTDQLTGLPNRRAWDEELGRLIGSARRTGDALTVALADLDHFKDFNDRHGHAAGDLLLKGFACDGRRAIRSIDIMARWGGEEFAVALPACPGDEATAVLNRLRLAMSAGQTCSIGFATWDGTESALDLLDRADRALYEAKGAGRDRLCAADGSFDGRSVHDEPIVTLPDADPSRSAVQHGRCRHRRGGLTARHSSGRGTAGHVELGTNVSSGDAFVGAGPTGSPVVD